MTASDLSDPRVSSHLTELVIDVLGVPVPQGSKRIGRTKAGKPIILDDNDARLRAWRKSVSERAGAAVRRDGWLLADDVALRVVVDFFLPRPKSVGRRRRPHVKPDVDKLARAVLDGLTDVVYRDDARVVELVARKHYALSLAGARVLVRPVTDEEEQG